jgi:hypothetical protein
MNKVAKELAEQLDIPQKEADKPTVKRQLKREWQAGSERTANIITLSLNALVKARLTEEDFNNSLIVIEHLRKLYKSLTNAEFFMLMCDLFNTKFYIFNTTKAYLTYIRTINNKITRTKVKLTPKKRALLCLTIRSYLPTNYLCRYRVFNLHLLPLCISLHKTSSSQKRLTMFFQIGLQLLVRQSS